MSEKKGDPEKVTSNCGKLEAKITQTTNFGTNQDGTSNNAGTGEPAKD